jgi:hypothetical protein
MGLNEEEFGFWSSIIIALLTTGTMLLGMWLNKKLSNNKQEKEKNTSMLDEMQTQVSESNMVYNKLKSLRDMLGADRVCIYQFHNGERFIGTNDSFKRVSNTYEVCGPGVSSEVSNLQLLPVSVYSMVINTMMNENYLFAADVDKSPELMYNLALLKQRGVKSIYKVPVLNLQGRIIAFITSEWVGEQHDFNPHYLAHLTDAATIISGYLHTKYKKKTS